MDGNPLQYSCLENSIDRRAWKAAVHGITSLGHDWACAHHTHTESKKFLCTFVFSPYVVFDSLWPHGLQHTRLLCPSLSPGGCSDSCPMSWWCHPTISFSVIPFSSCLQSFPASGSFPMSQLFASGDPMYWSFSFITSLSNEYSGLISFRIDWFDLAVQGLSSLFQHYNLKASILLHSAFFMVQLSPSYMTTGKTIALPRWRSPRDSQESFPTPQSEGINSSALNLLYGSTLTSIHDYWKNHSFA